MNWYSKLFRREEAPAAQVEAQRESWAPSATVGGRHTALAADNPIRTPAHDRLGRTAKGQVLPFALTVSPRVLTCTP
jgi:hypothetical protein